MAEVRPAHGGRPGAESSPAARTCWCSSAPACVQPTAFVDIKRIPELVGIIDRRERLASRRRDTAAADSASTRTWRALAGPGRSRAPDRLDADSGPRHGRRQPLQRLAGGRHDLCAHRQSRARASSPDPRASASSPSRSSVIGPGQDGPRARANSWWRFAIPRPAPRTADAYLRLIPRTEMDIAVAGAAVSVTLDAGGVCTAARVAIAAVAPTPLLVPDGGRRSSDRGSTTARSPCRRRRAAPPPDRSTTNAAPSAIAGRSPVC